MNSRNSSDAILLEIAALEKEAKKLADNRRYLNSLQKATKKHYKEKPMSDDSAFNRLKTLTIKHSIQEAKTQHRLNSLRLLAQLMDQPNHYFERIIIGAGVAGTLVFEQLTDHYRTQTSALPNFIVLNDAQDPNTWLKEGKRLMGQPAKLQTPQSFSVHSDDLLLKEEDSTNPYKYVEATDFYHALLETQNDLQMPIVDLKALRIESSKHVQDKWEVPAAKYRIMVEVQDEVFYLYTDAIDICAGLGAPTKLNNEQIAPELSKKLISEGKLLYAQDGGEVALKNDVLMYGGSAINSAWATEILSGHTKTPAKISYLVARNPKSLDDISTLSRFISNACESELKLAVGSLETVSLATDGRVVIKFKASNQTGGHHALKEGEELFCDQLIVAIGQRNPDITKELTDFVECMYETSHTDTLPIPLGTHSKDGAVISWGAVGTLGIGLEKQAAISFNKKVEAHADSYPYEAQALGGLLRVSWVIKQMAEQLRGQKMFPAAIKSADEYLLSDINQATIEDLISLIAESNPLCDAARCKDIAKEIIRHRSRVMDNADFNDPGIRSINQLKEACPSDVSVEAMVNKYFKFARKRGEDLHGKVIVQTPPVVTQVPVSRDSAYKPLSWLSTRKTQDASIQVSAVRASAHDDTIDDDHVKDSRHNVKVKNN